MERGEALRNCKNTVCTKFHRVFYRSCLKYLIGINTFVQIEYNTNFYFRRYQASKSLNRKRKYIFGIELQKGEASKQKNTI